MNRVILIGNGFDLAHGMRTSYQDFLNDFWDKTISEIQKLTNGEKFENDDLYIEKVPKNWTAEKNFNSLISNLIISSTKHTIKDSFINHITKKKRLQNWVDIEEEYYTLLKENIHKEKTDDSFIDGLNTKFKRVKDLLETYLREVQDKNTFDDVRIKSSITQKIYTNLNYKDFAEKSINKRINQLYEDIKDDIRRLQIHSSNISYISKNVPLLKKINYNTNEENIKKELRDILLSDEVGNYLKVIPEQLLFLNFNYTDTESYYGQDKLNQDKEIHEKTIHIHGNLYKKDNNPIIFGFGDEIDHDYKEIEKLNNNKYLENIKSIKYLETDNYRKLNEFLSSDDYQIFIFGHSCGISDRTLLNALFENSNCVSIKPFYYEKNEFENNYSDLIRNISRNFNNKLEMRDKVVNKKYCEPLT